jgi:hypothetical protein
MKMVYTNKDLFIVLIVGWLFNPEILFLKLLALHE